MNNLNNINNNQFYIDYDCQYHRLVLYSPYGDKLFVQHPEICIKRFLQDAFEFLAKQLGYIEIVKIAPMVTHLVGAEEHEERFNLSNV